jgi:hypothetical protein
VLFIRENGDFACVLPVTMIVLHSITMFYQVIVYETIFQPHVFFNHVLPVFE